MDNSSLPRHTIGADGPYWSSLVAGRPELPRCEACGRWHWPAVFRCGECGSWDQRWHAATLQGTVFSWTRTWHPFAGSEGIGVPYVSLIGSLPAHGGLRLLGILKGEEDGLCIGAQVYGEVAETAFGEDRIPSLRWSLQE